MLAQHAFQPGFLRNILGLVTGYGLLTVTGNEHKQMRKAMNPAFSIPNLAARKSKKGTVLKGPHLVVTQRFLCISSQLTGMYYDLICRMPP